MCRLIMSPHMLPSSAAIGVVFDFLHFIEPLDSNSKVIHCVLVDQYPGFAVDDLVGNITMVCRKDGHSCCLGVQQDDRRSALAVSVLPIPAGMGKDVVILQEIVQQCVVDAVDELNLTAQPLFGGKRLQPGSNALRILSDKR